MVNKSVPEAFASLIKKKKSYCATSKFGYKFHFNWNVEMTK